MTTAISSHAPVLRPAVQAADMSAINKRDLPADMDASMMLWLGRMMAPGMAEAKNRAKPGGAEVELRPASATLQQAQQSMAGVVTALRELAAMSVGERGPLSGRDGIEARGSEAAGGALGSVAQRAAGVHLGPQGVNASAGSGDDSESPAIGWMSGNRFGELLSLLRSLFLEIEEMHRDNSVRDTLMARQQTINAGQAGISKAKENFFGAIGAAAVGGAIGGAGLRTSAKATNLQTKSIKVNQGAAHKIEAASHEGRAIARANGHIDAEMSVGRGGVHAGDASGAQNLSTGERATLAEARVMRETADAQSQKRDTQIYGDQHGINTVHSQQGFATAAAINMMGQPVAQLVTSGAGINAEAWEAERQMMQHVAEVFVRIGSTETEQSAKTRDQRASVDALVRDMNSLDSDTASSMIRRI